MREQQPPALAPPPPLQPGVEDAEGLNWEMTSMLSALPIQYSYSDSAPDLHPSQGLARPAPATALELLSGPSEESGGVLSGGLPTPAAAAAAHGTPALPGGDTAPPSARSPEAAPVVVREQPRASAAAEPKRNSKDAGAAHIAAYSHGTMVDSHSQPAVAV